MSNEDIYNTLANLTEEMYFSIAKSQGSQILEQIAKYHSIAENQFNELITAIEGCEAGEILKKHQKKIRVLYDDFHYMKNISAKQKIYIRGCGNAGKSTLLNALLSLNEEQGSKMGKLPTTFVIDAFTDELEPNKAEIRTIDSDGHSKYEKMSRKEAIGKSTLEEKLFSNSKEKCQQEIEKRCEKVFLESQRKDIEYEIFTEKLFRTSIREIKWGIGKNNTFHNCILIDTPGLTQELRFTNVLEDVKNYEVDGIIWVISSEMLSNSQVVEAYKQELEEMRSIYKSKKVIAVINMYGDGPEYHYKSSGWNEIEKGSQKIYKKLGFDSVICVNCKLAYEANLKNNEEYLYKSNISALRKAINEMFAERNSKNYYQKKVNKIDNFLRNIRKETNFIKDELQKIVDEYIDKENKIKSQTNASKNLVDTKKTEILKLHLEKIKDRITNNIDEIDHLYERSANERDIFVRDRIIFPDVIQNDVNRELTSCYDSIYKDFSELQTRSIISIYTTTEFIVNHFEKTNTSLVLSKNNKLPKFEHSISGWEASINIITDLFGDNEITRGISSFLKAFRDAIKSPQERLYSSIEKELKNWLEEINLDEDISYGENLCLNTLNCSMKQTCCRYEDAVYLIENLDNFNNEKTEMIWEDVGLKEVLGGV